MVIKTAVSGILTIFRYQTSAVLPFGNLDGEWKIQNL